MSIGTSETRAFTCLLPVHPTADAALFVQAAESLGASTLPPAEVIVCQDGEPPPALAAAIAASGFRVLANPGPRGLPHALNAGLARARTPFICRADADDLNRSDRFAAQAAFLADHPEVDVLGGAIEEHLPSGARRVKVAPLTHREIVRRARWRNPMHHMTVVFRVDAVRACGGYPAIPFKEDYGLWLRLIAQGARFANLPDVLVGVRCGDLVGRRSGLHNLASERALWRLRREGQRGIGVPEAAAHAARAAALAFPPIAALGYAVVRRR